MVFVRKLLSRWFSKEKMILSVGCVEQYFDILSKTEVKPDETNEEGDVKTSLSGKQMSEIYGAEHLLRLFVKLPSVLAHTDLEENNCKVLVDSFQDILKFMSRNASSLFLQEYEHASAGHIRVSS